MNDLCAARVDVSSRTKENREERERGERDSEWRTTAQFKIWCLRKSSKKLKKIY